MNLKCILWHDWQYSDAVIMEDKTYRRKECKRCGKRSLVDATMPRYKGPHQ